MLDKVESIDRVDWVLGDIATWEPPQPVDMIFANASLHWLDDHAALFGRLIGFLAPRGTLAVQMPRNHGEPSHQILYETARSDRWSSRVAHLIRQAPVLPPTAYHEMVRPMSTELDVWETVYLQQMTGPDPVAAFTRGSAVRPFLDALGDDGDDFFADYSARLRPAYLAGDDGITLFSFRRVFIVATV
jgi:trans-aconitate 2-methyltransferase